jgi:hypothetical protein
VGGTPAAPTATLSWRYTQGSTPGLTFNITKTVGAGGPTTLATGIPVTGATTPGTVTNYTFTDNNAAPAATTVYRVYAVNSNSLSAPASVSITTAAPLAPPTNLRTVSITATQVFLAWNAPVPITGVTGYQIWRAPELSGGVIGTFAQVGTSATTNYRDQALTPLPASRAYYYQVRATGVGNSSAFTSPPLRVPIP